ncbi:homocysteine S-methyltransferase family protein [Sulfitobacter sp. D35]|uniref:homocysteine S-methyltransferase family protein n=1 Tax=Sulfitobacter sp. D35 TaxID=3083252 RepID=UPI00296F205C|nr:homocysteine S-methyltransferase family protein [Sulfitobacter sp. D35]MDW4497712.1 homocysteine S-methyltransferase family protein [Sulfitobacter sp. D35]
MRTSRPFLTDGGLETSLIFHQGQDLPCFAAFPLLETATGRDELRRYFEGYIDLAARTRRGFVLDTVTWRANMGWAEVLGRSAGDLRRANHAAVQFARALVVESGTGAAPIVINGVIGPSGDGYDPGEMLTVDAARTLHAVQVEALAAAGADMATAVTMTHAEEAIGIAKAAMAAELPVAISFTVETDGHLPSGQTLGEAIAQTDRDTGGGVLYYMINCAHPDHFAHRLGGAASWLARIGGLRTNASRMSHAELDCAEDLDDGDPAELGRLCADLQRNLPNLRVIGGCCGTDHRHVGCMSDHLEAHIAA